MTVFATIKGAVARLRQPAYTGANRCLPCTGVSLVLAGLLTMAVWTRSPPAGLLVGAGALVAITLRGYLVPGTPELETDPEALLQGLGVLVERGGDVVVAPDVADTLRDAVIRVGEHPTRALAALLDIEPERLALSSVGERVVAAVDGQHTWTWDSWTALLTDLATDAVLARRDPQWPARSLPVRAATLAAVRLCLERCPTCDGTVAIGSEVQATCCQEGKIVTVGCLDCGARLFTTET